MCRSGIRHLSDCSWILFFLIHLRSVFTVPQSHADLKPPRSALSGLRLKMSTKREEKTDFFFNVTHHAAFV